MKLIVYDVEVFKYDWIVVFKEYQNDKTIVFHNDPGSLKSYINPESIYIGFNSKFYDQYIIKGIAAGLTNEQLKELNDFIISGNQGWQFPLLQGFYLDGFNNADIRDDMQKGLSLKAIEGHLNLPIVESNIPFDLDRPLTKNELYEVSKYCTNDVKATENLITVRYDYLQTKLNLGARANISPAESLSMTNAKLTAAMLGAERKKKTEEEWVDYWTKRILDDDVDDIQEIKKAFINGTHDGRDYVYPDNLDLSLIPEEVKAFFDTIYDHSIDDETLFSTLKVIDIGGVPCTFGWGGVHGSLSQYHEKTTDTRIIQNRDVSSLYPKLIEKYGYLSRNVPEPQVFYDLLSERIEAKRTGDKQTANDLKLPLNTISGAQENQYNDLYDPLPTRSLRITGQLFMCMLTVKLLKECKTIKLLNLNTDGVMYSIDKTELPIVDRVCLEWEKISKFELETDEVKEVWIKDVNNLISIDINGKIKTVGSYLNYGISNKGAWSINNNAIIVKKALIEYFVNGTLPELVVNNSTNIFDFQIIAKAGSMYRNIIHGVGGKQIKVQNVNRVYATANKRYGSLYKIKDETGTAEKIALLPENCLIDNENKLTIKDIDKQYYIDLALKRIGDFTGKSPEGENMSTAIETKKTTPVKKTDSVRDLNVYEKLLEARIRFLAEGTKKSGKNIKYSYMYFELEDIVPIATPIFAEVGLLPIVSFSDSIASMSIKNVDNNDDPMIIFTLPMRELDPVTSKTTGGEIMNALQRLGAAQTYMRRYLYMIALDIVEKDDIDSGVNDITPTTTPKPVIPVSVPEKREIKKELTDVEGKATDLQITALKNALSKLREIKPETDQTFIIPLAVKTKSFTELNKADCEKIILQVGEMINE